MADEVEVQQEQKVDKPPEYKPDEAVDAAGVLWRERVAEHQRKAEEAMALNRQYQEELGRMRMQPPPKPVETATGLERFDDETRAALAKFQATILSEAEKIAERKGYQLMAQVSQSATLQDQEIRAEAERQYGMLKQNPLWASVNDTLLTDRALAEAKVVVGVRKKDAEIKTLKAESERALAESARLPRTERGSPPPTPEERDKFIADFKLDPEQINMHRQFCRGKGISPESEEGKKFFTEVAETAWKGIKFSGTVATAMQSGFLKGAQ